MRGIERLYPYFLSEIRKLDNACKQKGIPILFTETLRTAGEQEALYAIGRTKPGNIVTNARGSDYSSLHQWGLACDFCKNVKGEEYTDTKFFDEVGELAESFEIGWGGRFSYPIDKPHLYYTEWGKTAVKIKSIYNDPNTFIKTWLGIEEKNDLKRLEWFITNVQRCIDVREDGIIGIRTINALPTISKKQNNKHPVVPYVQQRINDTIRAGLMIDGHFGEKTECAVIQYQKQKGCVSDGVITGGKLTWFSLLGIA